MPILNNRGFGLIEILITSVLAGAVGMTITQLLASTLKVQYRNNTTASLDSLRRNFIALVHDEKSWAQILNDPANLSLVCVREKTPCTHNGNSTTGSPPGTPLTSQSFRVLDASGNIFYDTLTDPSAGFKIDGSPCTGYSESGNDNCPVQFELAWSALCTGECRSPQLEVKGKMKFRAATSNRKLVLNQENYSIDLIRGSGGTTGGIRHSIAYLSSDVNVARAIDFVIPWHSSMDCCGFWSAAQPHRLTIPAGSDIRQVRVGANVYFDPRGGDFQRWLSITKNGTGGLGMPSQSLRPDISNTYGLSVLSPVIDVLPGDYFEAHFFTSGANDSLLRADEPPVPKVTWFSIEEVR